MKIDRMIGILSILLQQEKVTAPYLAEKFEVSRRTINRDIEELCMAGIPLVTTQGVNGGISIMEGYKLDKTLITSSEMQSILEGLRSLDSVSGTNRYAQLMEKLSVGSSDILTADQHILINLASWAKEEISLKIEVLHTAIKNTEKVSFTYYSPKGETKRVIEPYKLVFQWSNWYVWGWCLKRQDFRLFKLKRMIDVQVEDRFERRDVIIPDLSQEKVFPHYYQVKARIQPEYEWRLVDSFGMNCFTVQEDATLLFSYGFTDKESIIGWILSFGAGAELIEPEEIREDIVKFIDDVRKNYINS